jgi:RecB family exonuclease
VRLTNSEATAFRRCRRKWWLSYYRRLAPSRPPTPTSPREIGTVVHDALAAYYASGADPVAHVRLGHGARAVASSFYGEKEAQKATDLAALMVEGYLEWLAETGADSDMEILGSELSAEAELAPGVTVMAKLDAVVDHRPTGQKLAFEFKTVSDLKQQRELLKLDTQFLTEHLVRFLIQIRDGAEPREAINDCSGVLWRGLKRVKRTATAKPPFYAEEVVPHNLDELRNHWRHVLAIAREIETARARLDAGESHHRVVPPSPDKTCSWSCDFFHVCPMFDDGSRVEAALEAGYVEVDPLARYEGIEAL